MSSPYSTSAVGDDNLLHMPASGDRIYAADVDDLEDQTTGAPIGRLVQTVAQTGIASNTATAITFTTEDVDSHGYHDNATNNSRVTPTLAGWYRVSGAVCIAGATDYTVFEAVIGKNGTAIAPATRTAPNATSNTLLNPASALVECNGSSDYFELRFRATKGAGTISTAVSSQFASVLEWEFVRPS